jgi:PKD repeat protein
MDCEAIDLTGTDPKIYCGGGYRSSGQSTLYIYDINSDIWSTGASLPESRYNYASVTHDNLYYVIGGLTSTYTNSMLVYNPSSNTWDETKAPMAEARSYFSAGLIGGKIYAAGGYNPDPLSSLEIYDIAADTWSAGADLPTSWLNAADGVVQDRFLVLVGGFENGPTTASNRALVYDAVHESWSRLPIFNHAIYGAEGAGNGEQFWVVSGRLYEDSSFKNSTYTTKMLDCEGGVCISVTDPNFTWEPLTPAVGTLVTFTATVGGGSPAITYTWDFGDGSTGTGVNPEHTFASSGTYSVTLTVSNCDGANTASISHDVTVSDVCVPVTGPDFTWAPLTPTAGDSVTFTSSVAGGSLPIAYNWDFGDGSTGTDVNPEHTFASSGTYSVTLTVSNCGGSSTDFITKDVTVLPPESGVTIYLPLIVR